MERHAANPRALAVRVGVGRRVAGDKRLGVHREDVGDVVGLHELRGQCSDDGGTGCGDGHRVRRWVRQHGRSSGRARARVRPQKQRACRRPNRAAIHLPHAASRVAHACTSLREMPVFSASEVCAWLRSTSSSGMNQQWASCENEDRFG
eukprot:1727148-Prymnesium_polylepis.1